MTFFKETILVLFNIIEKIEKKDKLLAKSIRDKIFINYKQETILYDGDIDLNLLKKHIKILRK